MGTRAMPVPIDAAEKLKVNVRAEVGHPYSVVKRG